MKLLRINDKQGKYLNLEGEYLSIDKLSKDDLIRFVSMTLSNAVDFDEYDEKLIMNQAHQIIYKNVYEKLIALQGRKEEFIDETERLYLSDYEKYKEESTADADLDNEK